MQCKIYKITKITKSVIPSSLIMLKVRSRRQYRAAILIC